METNSSRAQGGEPLGHRQEQQGKQNATATSARAQPRKWQRVLRGFLERGAQGLNRFEAARELRDHVLPTTVAQLGDRGVRILRRSETVPGFMGAPTDCARYWIDPASRETALALLGEVRAPGA